MRIVPPPLEELARLASDIAERGWPVFPCGFDKAPLTAHGHKDATSNPKLAYNLFMSHPDARLVAVPMGMEAMILAIDIDPLGMRWFQMSWHRLGNPRIHRTPRGGSHLYYKLPGPPCPVITCRQTCDGQRLLSEGVDVKAEGGYVIWAGPGYTVVNNVEPCDLPIWLKNRLIRQPKKPKDKRIVQIHHGVKALEGALARVIYSKTGERNSLLFWSACRAGELVKEGVLSKEEAIRICSAAGQQSGLSELESRRTAKSGVETGKRG